MASKIERIAGRALAVMAVVGLFSLQGCFHPHLRHRGMGHGHVKHSVKHSVKRGHHKAPKKRVRIVPPRPWR